MTCIFCSIVAGEISSVKVYEDKDFLAFLDVKPINAGHVLLIPKEHQEYLFDLSDQKYSALLLKGKELAILLKDKLNPIKVGMVVEGFGVSHIHIHLIPLNNAGDLHPERAKEMRQEELEKIAQKINAK